MKNVGKIFSMVFALSVLTACEPQSRFEFEALAVPAKGEAFAPQLFSANGRISLSWLERNGSEHALRYSEWKGGHWGDAITVRTGSDWFANWADLPGVRPLSDGRWMAWWLQKSGEGTYAYDVQLAFSDDGVKWTDAGTPHRDGTQTEHGFATAFELPNDEVALAWLDGRNTSGAGHAHHGMAGMTLRYGVFDNEGNRTGGAEIDSLTCDCCQTDSALAGDAVVLAYRDRTESEIRDILVTRYANDSWSEPLPVHADGWKIDGCPVNGPAIAAGGDLVAVAWFTAPKGRGEVRVAFSDDGGRSFAAPFRVDDGHPQGRVDIALDGGSALVSWIEQGDAGAEVRLRSFTPNGAKGDSIALVETDAGRAAGFPRTALLGNGGLLLTWTDAGGAARQLRSARIQMRE